jgi:hypothetical protein
MPLFARAVVIASLLLFAVPSLRAQAPVDPSGHWEGSIQAQSVELRFEVDLATNSKGDLVGTISTPAQNVRGLPLKRVAVDGRSIGFHARADQPFNGVLSADGKSLSGTLTANGSSLPVNMTRTGEASIEARGRSAAIGNELVGTWNATLNFNGTQVRLVLTMSNQSDGTAIGSLINLDEGGLEVPASTIAQEASGLSLEFKAVGGSYSGTLSNNGTELVGTYRQGALIAPVTFRQAAK